jgi:hypothetical protein
MQQLIMNRRSIWRATNGVLERKCIVDELGKIIAPTLVMVGDEDVSTPKVLADRIVGGIANAKLIVIPGAGHSATLEQPAIVTAAIGAFLDARGAAVPSRGAAAWSGARRASSQEDDVPTAPPGVISLSAWDRRVSRGTP